jgi:hypothetical protein
MHDDRLAGRERHRTCRESFAFEDDAVSGIISPHVTCTVWTGFPSIYPTMIKKCVVA